jgi:hypothetical protein
MEAFLDTIQRAQALCPGCSLMDILDDLGLPAAMYHRWCERAVIFRTQIWSAMC